MGVANGRFRCSGVLLCLWVLCQACWADSVVVVNEIMYHPAGDGPEWIELYNQMGIDIDMSAWSLQGAVKYTFPDGTIIQAGSYLVVASDPVALIVQSGYVAPVLGPFEGKLGNDGETIRLVTNSGRLLNRVEYGVDGEWPVASNGSGVSLARIHPMRGTDDVENWTWSDQVGGTPGWLNFSGSASADRPLRFNEIDGAGGTGFRIEVVNQGADPVSLQDYRLEIQGGASAIWSLPAVPLEPGQLYAISDADFGDVPGEGDRLFLWQGDTAVSDATVVGARAKGRYPDGSDLWCVLNTTTFGAANEVELCSDVVINEILYHPLETPASDESEDSVILVPDVASAKILVPSDGALGTTWTGGSEPFEDSAWTQASTGIGYEAGTGYQPYIGGDTQEQMYGLQGSVFIRIPFDVADPAHLESVSLWMRYDDGFVAYLNGREIARVNAPETLIWNSLASASHDDIEAEVFQEFAISGGVELLKAGRNVLAIQGLNASTTSTDFLIQPRLDAVQSQVSTDSSQFGADSRTWIELHNKGSRTVDLSGWRLAKGVSYTIPNGTALGPDGYLVIAKDPNYLSGLYPDIPIAGGFSGRLSNSGEKIVLVDAAGNQVDQVRYFDGGSWPSYADGGGCSLELTDPRADNNVGQAWAASDEFAKTTWQSFAYRGVAQASPVGDDSLYHEFVMGLLDDGEVLIDDLRVIENPDGTATDLLQNGDFTNGTTAWRIIGNHSHSLVEPDPEDAANPVLHLVATGPTEHMSNHAETTLAGGRSIQNGQTYEIRFRARWIAGCPQLNTRLFFNRLAKTTILTVPEKAGTPGHANSRWKANVGPTCSGLKHEPAVPTLRESVQVTVQAQDLDGVQSVTLWYRPDEGSWRSVEMEPVDGVYVARIPPYSSGTLIQFYASAVDSLGQESWCPQAGPNSFAQYRVDDGKARTTGVHNYRIVMRNEQRDLLYTTTNLMSNDYLGATLIYNEQEAYYDVGVHLKSSEHGRPKSTRVGFAVSFSPEHPFRGVHERISFDRSNGQAVGQEEMLLHAAMNRYGGFSKYHDLGYVIAPNDSHSSGVEVQMARYEQLYCEEMYGDEGGDGTLFEYELVYPLTETVGNDPEGLKIPQEGGGVEGLSVSTYLGEDREKYRWHFLIKNNRDQDNYAPIIRMTQVLSLSGTSFEDGVEQYLDVPEWLRAFAIGSAIGVSDNWISNSQHNALFYHRPTDDKMLFFLHDLDYYNSSMSLRTNSVLQRLTGTSARSRVFYGCVYDFLTVSFNREYMSYWVNQYKTLLPEQSWDSWLSYVASRYNNAMSQVLSAVPTEVPFKVLAVSGQAVTGQGWITVQEIRLRETDSPLDVTWQDWTTWQAALPEGVVTGTLAAYNSLGEQVGTAAIP